MQRLLEAGDVVDIIGGVYKGRMGIVERLAGKESVKIAVTSSRTGLTKSYTIRSRNTRVRETNSVNNSNKAGKTETTSEPRNA